MSKAITDGLDFMPTPFSAGLGVWSSQDGTPGSDTYAGAGGGVFVPADQDFGGCLEIVKTTGTQKVRFMGDTPILPGCYLEIRARVKCVAGAFPAVRIAGWPGTTGSAGIAGLPQAGPGVQLMSYGEVVEVRGIVGTGARGGVAMVWPTAQVGHLGIDFTGPNGAVLRIDDIEIEDVTRYYLRDLMGLVDVRDYGAVGDGVTNDAPAFAAADAAANGREVLVSQGTYRLDGNVTLQNQVRFEGTVTQPAHFQFILQRNFDYVTYLDAFGGDEETAFRKAYQALLNFADHESLDLGGRRINLSAPVDLQAADPARTSYATRRVIRNGQFQPIDGPAWSDAVVTSQATYATSSPLTLTNVVNAANVPRGALVTGNGVGREVYVRDVNVAQGRVTLSAPLFDAAGTQRFTFRRFKYLLDFSGYDSLSQFHLDDIEFQCNGKASGILLARDGLSFCLRDCFVTKPKDRGLTSIGEGCQGMLIDRCQFLSNEQDLAVEQRTTVAFNANANDVKIRDNRVVLFKHFCVLGGSGSMIVGNHWFHGDSTSNGVRKGGIVLTQTNPKTIFTGNYVDNNFIEWTNEHDATPALGSEFSFGGVTITGNIFTANDVAPWFTWLVVKPYGPGHFVHGLSVVSNVFRALNGNITRVEAVDTTYADLDYNRMRAVTFEGNVFHGVTEEARNPVSVTHSQATADRIWIVDSAPHLPFRGWARTITSVVPEDRLVDAANNAVYEAPWVDDQYGPTRREFRVVFATPCTGTIRCEVRMDNPL